MVKQTAGRDALTGFADEFAIERSSRLLFPVSYADCEEERSDKD